MRSVRVRWLACLLVGASVSIVAPAAGEDIPHPNAYFGREVGAAGVLIRHSEILEYYELLAHRSDRVQLHHLGDTTDGRPFYYALISAPGNLARLDDLLADNARLYDPRGLGDAEANRILEDGRAIVIVNGQIHSTEVGASQGGVLLAHRLASATDSETEHILENVVIAHVPVHNPDGQEMVARWLDSQRGTAHQNSPPPFLYQRYAGHDNNRDWYMFTQLETRLSIRLDNRLHPQFTLDQHQQGSNQSRIFVPPFEDPWEPNVDAALIASNNLLGTFMGQYLTARGYRGVEWKQRYDAWTPARAYPHTHGGVRLLTEVASANYADDLEIAPDQLAAAYRERHWYFPDPWPGGTWRFRDVVDYHYAGAMAALRAAADLRPHLLRGMLEAQRRSVSPPAGAPYAFVMPASQPDPPVAAKLQEVLLVADVELEVARAPFTATGRDYDAGSVVVRFAQPAGRFAKSVLERQQYPRMYLYEGGPIDPPYDVTAHTLPLMMNVVVDTVVEPFAADLEAIESPRQPTGGLVDPSGDAVTYLLDARVNNTYGVAAQLGGSGLRRSLEPFEAAGRSWPAGSWIYTLPKGAASIAALQQLAALVAENRVTAWGVSEPPSVSTGWVAEPRVGIYQSYVPSMPEGWTRFVFEQHGIPFDTIGDGDIRRGDLDPYGLLIVPPASADDIVAGLPGVGRQRNGRRRPPSPPRVAGGSGAEGVAALRAYLAAGGTVLTWGASTELAVRYFDAPQSLHSGLSRTVFNVPGSILRARMDTGHWLGFGMQTETPVFFWNSPFWKSTADARVVASYPGQDLLMSGWIQGEQELAGSAALLELPRGDGRLIMIGFSPEYRAQTHHTFKVLFNAVFRPRTERPAG